MLHLEDVESATLSVESWCKSITSPAWRARTYAERASQSERADKVPPAALMPTNLCQCSVFFKLLLFERQSLLSEVPADICKYKRC